MRKPVILNVLAFAILLMIQGLIPAHADLLAPVYPGAVPADRELSDNQRLYERVFFVHQPIQDVVSFYENNIGPIEEVRSGQEYQNLVRHPPRVKASSEPDFIGIRILSRAPMDNGQRHPTKAVQDGMNGSIPAEAAEVLPDRCRSEHFEMLRVMVHQLDQYDWNDFEEICSRFGHVDWAYFQMTDERDERGRVIRMDRLLLTDHKNRIGMMDSKEMDVESLGQRMQELQMQGKFQEVAELARLLQEQVMKGLQISREGVLDKWAEWVEHLENLDGHAYRTMIRIHRNPSSWPENPF